MVERDRGKQKKKERQRQNTDRDKETYWRGLPVRGSKMLRDREIKERQRKT